MPASRAPSETYIMKWKCSRGEWRADDNTIKQSPSLDTRRVQILALRGGPLTWNARGWCKAY